MEIDGDDDYDYYETQPVRQDKIKAKAKPFGWLPFHLSLIQRTKKHAGSQFREEAGDILAILVSYLNRDIKKINILSSAVSARKYIADKRLGNRFAVSEQDLDDNDATPDYVVVYKKKRMQFIQSMDTQQLQDLATQSIIIKEIERRNTVQMLMIQNEQRWQPNQKFQEQKLVLT
ncbi:MAG: hypothetical protein EZS28_011421 [Streblomastix strix]|uniref:Uncharacterized protein n=1 Tax=Streblomastix strix TaxID=222440 RepID=A0A5J4WED7_9EUKA|nr:MAG: hypothetical protein EZS28_011421 [Streblomastix strix]